MPYTHVSHSYGFSMVICCTLKCKFWPKVFLPLLHSKGFSLFKKYLFFWLPWVLAAAREDLQPLVVACGIFSCSPWDLIPSSGIEPWPPLLWPWNLSPWTPGEAPEGFSWVWVLQYGVSRIWSVAEGPSRYSVSSSPPYISLFLMFERALTCGGKLCKFHDHFLSFQSTLCLFGPVLFFETRGLQPARLLCPWDSPGKDTGVGCSALLQEIFPTQGSNPGLQHCRKILYYLSHQGSRPPPQVL